MKVGRPEYYSGVFVAPIQTPSYLREGWAVIIFLESKTTICSFVMTLLHFSSWYCHLINERWESCRCIQPDFRFSSHRSCLNSSTYHSACPASRNDRTLCFFRGFPQCVEGSRGLPLNVRACKGTAAGTGNPAFAED